MLPVPSRKRQRDWWVRSDEELLAMNMADIRALPPDELDKVFDAWEAARAKPDAAFKRERDGLEVVGRRAQVPLG